MESNNTEEAATASQDKKEGIIKKIKFKKNSTISK